MFADLLTNRPAGPTPEQTDYATRMALTDLTEGVTSTWEAVADFAYLINAQTGERVGYVDLPTSGQAHRAARAQITGHPNG